MLILRKKDEMAGVNGSSGEDIKVATTKSTRITAEQGVDRL